MPIERTITLYTYSELPTDKAKERARDWWREASAGDNFFAEHITDEMHEALKALGFDPYVRTIRATLAPCAQRCDGPVSGRRATAQPSGEPGTPAIARRASC